VPGKDSKYEWEGYVGFDQLPASFNPPPASTTPRTATCPEDRTGYDLPLGFEYTQPFGTTAFSRC
jgi:acyl-homoserine lactone acylase PvdQ